LFFYHRKKNKKGFLNPVYVLYMTINYLNPEKSLFNMSTSELATSAPTSAVRRHYSSCPLGLFSESPAGGDGGAGAYECDPVAACYDCNFGDRSVTPFDWRRVCQCPVDSISGDKYAEVQRAYLATEGEHSPRGFWDFAKKQLERKVQARTVDSKPKS
jgi:hypothetical protein